MYCSHLPVPLQADNMFQIEKEMKLFYIAILSLLCNSAFADGERPQFAHADIIGQQELPTDTAYRTGVLGNGMTYYVVHSTIPEKSACLRLIVKGGSLVEQENERGIAHYVEHMMFKGTKHFPGFDGVWGFLRRNGLPVGHDSNAFTYHEAVIYGLDKVPTEKALLLDSCLLFLRDIANQDATITDEAVETEHSVITEEWRMRSPSQSSKGVMDLYLNYSDYSKRFPIGDIDIVRNCTPELVRNFYKRWYQPQNMAIIVAGDISMDEMEAKIHQMFGNISRGQNIVPSFPLVPENKTPQYRVFTEDKNFTDLAVVAIRLPRRDYSEKLTVNRLKEEWMENEIKKILKFRLDTLTASSDLVGKASINVLPISFTSNTRIMEFSFNSPKGSWESALQQLLGQIELIRREGFSEDDWEGWSPPKDIYNSDTTAIDFSVEETKTFIPSRKNTDWVSSLTTNYMEGKPVLHRIPESLARDHLMYSVPREELSEAFRNLTDGNNMMIYTVQPANSQAASPEKLEEVYNRVKNMNDEELALQQQAGEEFDWLDIDSVKTDPTPGSLKKFTVRNDSISQALLSNGVKVIFWKHKRADDYIIKIKLERPSGTSVLSNKDRFYEEMLTSCTRSYCGDYGCITIGPILHTWDDHLDAHIDVSTSNIDKKDRIFRQIHAILTPTEVDSVKFRKELKALKLTALNCTSPLIQSRLRFSNIYTPNPERLLPITPDLAATYNVSRLRELVKEYYSNWNGSVMVIQGEFDTDSIMPYVLKYIASLPSKPEPAKSKVWPSDHYRTSDTTLVEKIENNTPICNTVLYYTWEKGYKYSLESNAHNCVLQSVINSLLIKVIRNQHNDIYSGGCGMSDYQRPIMRMACSISFTCKPTDRVRITEDVKQLMHDMAEGDLITQDLIDGYIQLREKNVKALDDGGQLDLLLKRELYGTAIDANDLTYIRKVTPESLKAHLKRLLKKGNLHVGYLTTE